MKATTIATVARTVTLAVFAGPVAFGVADKNGNPLSDHAVVVTGADATNGIVHLNDSGTSDGRDEQIALQLFVQSWETSNELMAVTL